VGPLLELNQQLLDVSPYTHIHKIPGGEFAAEPIGWLLVLVAAITFAGVISFAPPRHRQKRLARRDPANPARRIPAVQMWQRHHRRRLDARASEEDESDASSRVDQ
ncbi:MAG: hypothetical protein ACRDTT_24085, partial [Pseudonocardiaceae bacterium]